MAGIAGRIHRLEASAGGECPRCSGVRGIFVTGVMSRADDKWLERVSAEGGPCPACGRAPTRINVVEEGQPWG